jgi:hypothetical protein
MTQPAPPIDGRQADRFLELLVKQPGTARLRAFPHRLNPNFKTIGPRKGGYDIAEASRWQREGRGVYLVINDGGDSKASITRCLAFFIEWDHKPVEWQLTAWKELGLGEPTMIITTGGKSAHLYWVLDADVDPERWAPIQAALIDFCGADPACKDASRVMRLPGASYIGPAGTATGTTEIVHESGKRYSLEEVQSWIIPDEFADLDERPFDGMDLGDERRDFPPSSMEQIREALAAIPAILPKNKQRKTYRKLAWGLLGAVREAGGSDADALALLEGHSPAVTDADEYLKTEPVDISANSFWWLARDAGWRPRDDRTRTQNTSAGQPEPGASQQQQAGPGPAPAKPPLLTITQVRERLAYLVEQGASRQDLEAERLELAAASDINPAALRDLLRSIEQEQEASHSIAAEVRSLREATEQKAVAAGLNLDYLLPPSLAQALQVRTRWLPADDVAALMTFLVTVSGVVKLGSEIIASEAADYRVPLNLYGALVARSGAKKSPLSKLLVDKPTRELRVDLARQHTRAMQAWTEENRGVKPSERPDPPQAVYLSVSDATAEALAQQLQIQELRGLGLLLHRDELAGLFGSLNQYRSGRGSDSEQLLEAYDGSGFRSLRVAATGGGRFYDRCHLSIWGTIQPAVLKALVADGDASGLWARFLFIPLPEKVVQLADEESEAERWDAEQAAAALAQVCNYVYRLPITSLTLNPDGRRAFMAYEARCQGDALAATIGAQGALFGKAPGKALRLAALLHLLHQAMPDGDHSDTIGAEAVRKACTLTDHLNAWTLGLHADAATGCANDLMRLVHRLAINAASAIGWRDIAPRLSKAQRRDIDSAAAAQAMEALAGMGAGELERGGRGALSYRATGVLA